MFSLAIKESLDRKFKRLRTKDKEMLRLIERTVNPSTPRPEGQGLLRVDPEPRFLTPSLKTGLGAAERVNDILADPYRFKPLRKPMQNKRRVHVGGPFVLIYEINEREQLITLLDFDHHDNIYKI